MSRVCRGDIMTVEQLITELQKVPQNLEVVLESEKANKVIVENCCGNEYVRICGGIDIGDIIIGSN